MAQRTLVARIEVRSTGKGGTHRWHRSEPRQMEQTPRPLSCGVSPQIEGNFHSESLKTQNRNTLLINLTFDGRIVRRFYARNMNESWKGWMSQGRLDLFPSGPALSRVEPLQFTLEIHLVGRNVTLGNWNSSPNSWCVHIKTNNSRVHNPRCSPHSHTTAPHKTNCTRASANERECEKHVSRSLCITATCKMTTNRLDAASKSLEN